MKNSNLNIAPVLDFLQSGTPVAWLDWADENTEHLLIDHAHCEKKAAMGGLRLINEYADKRQLLGLMSRLVREEMRHFEQVLALLDKRRIKYRNLSASGYARGLQGLVRQQDPQRLTDKLIVGAFIEARSCERFYVLLPRVEPDIAEFFRRLLESECRHFQDYLHLARRYADGEVEQRLEYFRQQECALIHSPDRDFRFHSGPPAGSL